jgi:hypothetical protein
MLDLPRVGRVAEHSGALTSLLSLLVDSRASAHVRHIASCASGLLACDTAMAGARWGILLWQQLDPPARPCTRTPHTGICLWV